MTPSSIHKPQEKVTTANCSGGSRSFCAGSYEHLLAAPVFRVGHDLNKGYRIRTVQELLRRRIAGCSATYDLDTGCSGPPILRVAPVTTNRAGHMDAGEADEWRRRIVAWSRFRLAAGSNPGMASRPYVHEVGR